jgi:hypothetical protein
MACRRAPTTARRSRPCVELERWAEEPPTARRWRSATRELASDAGLQQHLQHGPTVVEERPRRRDGRAGKFEPIDALTAARCALSSEECRRRAGAGFRDALRALLIAPRSAVAGRTRLLNQCQVRCASASELWLRGDRRVPKLRRNVANCA